MLRQRSVGVVNFYWCPFSEPRIAKGSQLPFERPRNQQLIKTGREERWCQFCVGHFRRAEGVAGLSVPVVCDQSVVRITGEILSDFGQPGLGSKKSTRDLKKPSGGAS